ncbi:MAG: beta-propeller fold lactonase family protein [Candidatus Eisenbacteria bacterium]|uniref:Beta-propeller fold lactonase family protein n=1 Tax=Eiseniibacteriota bacterium TaxID=2212470 RepID=A0A9D6L9D3_UNCEI|nr:beta-propeller fold lactonase family protein [Candidatus Eisenbacteria bacterium]
MRRISLVIAALVLAIGIAAAPRHLASHTQSGQDFVHFEAAHVRPASMTPDGNRLLVVNTPDNRLAVFDLTGAAPARIAEIPVGLEPVAVSALDNNTAWVVNGISNDVSVVDLTAMHVVATIHVGAEPNDVVFAGSPTRAYVSVSLEDAIKVYDPATLAEVATVPVNAHKPRGLARNAAGTLVYASMLQGGNRTSVLPASLAAGNIPDDPNFPRTAGNKQGNPNYPNQDSPRPAVGAVIQYLDSGPSGAGWYDEYAGYWSDSVPYTQTEVDVAEINTSSNTVSRNFGQIGSTEFGVAVNPVDGKIAVVGMQARNNFRFEPKVRGYLVETRLSFVAAGNGFVTNRILNPHITYLNLSGLVINPGTQTERDSAIATPTGVAWAASGGRVYVTSLSTNKLAVIDPAGSGSTSEMKARIRTVAGPTGVVVDDTRGLIYVVGRFHNQLETFSSAHMDSVAVAAIGFDPTPDDIVNGRKFFYGGFTSSHGDQSCASCHVFGDTDNLPWDLGDPAGAYTPPPDPNPLGLKGFDPEKGPMTTQTLRGLTSTEPLHWRGDRADLSAFNPAFNSLLGHSTGALPDSEKAAFNAFVMPLAYPSNPNQYLNDSLTDAPSGQPSAERGRTFFMNENVDGQRCVDCHNLPAGTNRQMVAATSLGIDQDMKVPQLRNLYTKTGFTNAAGATKRASGYTNDGTIDHVFAFLQDPRFNFGPVQTADDTRRDVAAYLTSFDTGTAPAVGFQVTFNGSGNPTGVAQVDTLETVYAHNRCDVIAKGTVGGVARGWVYIGGDQWTSDVYAETNLTTAQLIALASSPATALTVTGVPKGSGVRMGVDRDRDGFRDRDEIEAGSDPADPASIPPAGVAALLRRAGEGIEMVKPNPASGPAEIVFSIARAGRIDVEVYDLLGRATRTVARGAWFTAGRHSVVWDGRRDGGRDAGTGVYFVRVRSDHGAWTRMVTMHR